jgi:hypothetical protein
MVSVGPIDGTHIDICASKLIESISSPLVIADLNELDTNVIWMIIVVYDIFRSTFELGLAQIIII